jgi:serine/threonine protein kinase
MICPKCRRRFEDGDATKTCPDDQTILVRVSDTTDGPGDPMLGRTLDGRFTILSRLGAGSMGTVYRAKQHAMGREVAVKILRNDRAIDANAKGRFLREARANSLLASPHTVTVFDFGQSPTGELFLAMELLDGESLGQRITRLGRLPADVAIDTVRQALRSLAEAHAKGIIHRDLKPDNLFYARVVSGGQTEEIVKVLDFGVAKLVGDVNEPLNAIETQAGTVFGTPRYMSPEQAQGKPLDARTDLYSLGVILFHMITGRPPFTDDDAVVVMARHIKTAPPQPSTVCPEARIPADLEALLMRLLDKDPAKRPINAEALVQELAKLHDSGTAITSGVRVSVATNPSAFRVKDAVAAAGLAGGGAQPAADSLETAFMPKRRPRVMIALAVVAAVALAVLILRGTTFREPPLPLPLGAANPPAPMANPIPPPSPLAAGATPPPSAPTPISTIPSISATDLPRATAPPSATQAAGPPPRHPRAPRSPRGAAPAPTASSSYGLLE